MLKPRTLALAVVAVGTGAGLYLAGGQTVDNSWTQPAPPVAQAVTIPPTVTQSPVIPAAVVPAPVAKAVPAPVGQPLPKRFAPASSAPAKVAAKPARKSTPSTASQPPAYSQMDLGNGWSAYCNNGYLQPDGSCTSQPGGYHPPASPPNPSDPCSGTGSQCLDNTLGLLNPIPPLMGGH